MGYLCRGSSSTCGFPDSKNLAAVTKRPCAKTGCHFAFRFYQQESKDTNGFMVHVEEKNGLGDGQKIETEMAKEVGLKVFRVYTNVAELNDYMRDQIRAAVKESYEGGRANMDLENVFIGFSNV